MYLTKVGIFFMDPNFNYLKIQNETKKLTNFNLLPLLIWRREKDYLQDL